MKRRLRPDQARLLRNIISGFATITAEGESEKPLSVTVGSREKPPAGNSWSRSHAVRPMIIGIVAVASLRLG
jgi:hypothetical protein